MEQSQKTNNKIHIEQFIKNLDNTGRYSKDILALIKSDLEYGLTEEQVRLYYKKKLSIGQMRIYSKCLRNGYDADVIEVIMNNTLSEHQMSIAMEFYEKGVPIESIKEVINRDDTAFVMKEAYSKILKNLQETKKSTDVQEPAYVKKLFGQIEEVVSKINYQEKRYDRLNEKLKIFETTKRDEQIRDELVRENESKEHIINDQQDKLMQANSTIAIYRKSMDEREDELVKMQKRIDTLESAIVKKNENIINTNNDELNNEGVNNKANTERYTSINDSNINNKSLLFTPKQPTNYDKQIDNNTIIVQPIYFEKMSKKQSKGIIEILSSLIFRKRSRQDMVKLVIKGELVPAQLVQIKIAIEKGLTENQLRELINNNVSAENMKEIIEIAVLENSMQN